MKSGWGQTMGCTIIFVLLYVLIGNARSIEVNPFLDGAVIAVYMVIPVIAGILFGTRVGFLVGILGTAANAGAYHLYDVNRAVFEYLAILPHGVMGWCAGWLRGRVPTPFISPTIYVGHGLNVIMYLLAGKMLMKDLLAGNFWLGIGYEGLLEMVAIIVMVTVYRLGFPEPRT